MTNELKKLFEESVKRQSQLEIIMLELAEGRKEMQAAMKSLAKVVEGSVVFMNGLHDKVHNG